MDSGGCKPDLPLTRFAANLRYKFEGWQLTDRSPGEERFGELVDPVAAEAASGQKWLALD
jgi:hypothetical protein